MNKQFSQACENNKQAILEVLKQYLKQEKQVLEIGSGTGQHAVFFVRHLPFLRWHTSNYGDLSSIQAWVEGSGLSNVYPPLSLDVRQEWPQELYPDVIFTANTLHIMSWDSAQLLLQKAAGILPAQGLLFIYGPFNYDGQFSSDSNREFNAYLQARDPESAIRDSEAVIAKAEQVGLQLLNDHAMPANNRTLVFEKRFSV